LPPLFRHLTSVVKLSFPIFFFLALSRFPTGLAALSLFLTPVLCLFDSNFDYPAIVSLEALHCFGPCWVPTPCFFPCSCVSRRFCLFAGRVSLPPVQVVCAFFFFHDVRTFSRLIGCLLVPRMARVAIPVRFSPFSLGPGVSPKAASFFPFLPSASVLGPSPWILGVLARLSLASHASVPVLLPQTLLFWFPVLPELEPTFLVTR